MANQEHSGSSFITIFFVIICLLLACGAILKEKKGTAINPIKEHTQVIRNTLQVTQENLPDHFFSSAYVVPGTNGKCSYQLVQK